MNSLDTLRADHSLLTQYVRSKALSGSSVLVAAPVLATLDVAYHASAIPLKAVRAVLLLVAEGAARTLQVVGFNKPLHILHTQFSPKSSAASHVLPLIASVAAGIVYPLPGLLSVSTVANLHERMFQRIAPLQKSYRHLQMAALGIGAVAVAGLVAFLSGQKTSSPPIPTNPSGHCPPLQYPLSGRVQDSYDNPEPATVAITALWAFLSAGGLTAARRKGGRKTQLGAVALVVLSAGVLLGLYSQASRLDGQARHQLQKVCALKGPEHFSCHVEEMASQARRVQGTAVGQDANVADLCLSDLGDMGTLRRVLGTGQNQAGAKAREKIYHGLLSAPILQSSPMSKTPKDKELHAAAASWARTTIRQYTRERTWYPSQLFWEARDLLTYGHTDGPSYVQTAAKPKCLTAGSLDGFVSCITGSATSTNAKVDKLAGLLS